MNFYFDVFFFFQKVVHFILFVHALGVSPKWLFRFKIIYSHFSLLYFIKQKSMFIIIHNGNKIPIWFGSIAVALCMSIHTDFCRVMHFASFFCCFFPTLFGQSKLFCLFCFSSIFRLVQIVLFKRMTGKVTFWKQKKKHSHSQVYVQIYK